MMWRFIVSVVVRHAMPYAVSLLANESRNSDVSSVATPNVGDGDDRGGPVDVAQQGDLTEVVTWTERSLSDSASSNFHLSVDDAIEAITVVAFAEDDGAG